MMSRSPWAVGLLVVIACSEPATDVELEVAHASLERLFEMKKVEVDVQTKTISRLEGEVRALMARNTALESQVTLMDDSSGALAGLRRQVDACFAELL